VAGGSADLTRISTATSLHGPKNHSLDLPLPTVEDFEKGAPLYGIEVSWGIDSDGMKDHADDLKSQRDGWQHQAESAQRQLTHQRPRRGWFELGRSIL